jgi:hypothetical protein
MLRRRAGDELMGFDIPRHRGSSGDKARMTERYSAYNCCVRADGCTVFNDGWRDGPISRERSRRRIVGEGCRRADEDIGSQRHAVKHARIVLNLASIADNHVGIDEDILAENTLDAHPGAGTDMGVMPDSRSSANHRTGLDESALVHVTFGYQHKILPVPPRNHPARICVAQYSDPDRWVRGR